MSALAKISSISGDKEKFIVYAEGALDLDPSDTNLRFDLAYEHSDQKNTNLSLLQGFRIDIVNSKTVRTS